MEIVRPKPTTKENDFASAVRKGLSQTPKTLPCKFFYDREGAQLFEEITRLPEYYLTRTEEALIKNNLNNVVPELPKNSSLIELGGGSSKKTELFIKTLLTKQDTLHLTMIDISNEFILESAESLIQRFPPLTISAILSDYDSAFEYWKRTPLPTPKIILFLGSNLGNFDPPEAIQFLANIKNLMSPEDRFILGIDMQKDHSTLNAAYNDSAGVTARFNKNILARINRELGGKFPLEEFNHYAAYHPSRSRIEMHLVSKKEHTVLIEKLEQTFSFQQGETIHTENSYKYSHKMLEELFHQAHLIPTDCFTDKTIPYALCILKTK
ncbi:MAG: L-histidine N(alpha)-methyltransferase [Candidatus Caldarchaeum sp.]